MIIEDVIDENDLKKSADIDTSTESENTAPDSDTILKYDVNMEDRDIFEIDVHWKRTVYGSRFRKIW